MLRRILVPLDGSAFAEDALPLALHLARRHEAHLELARVFEPPAPVSQGAGAPVRDPTFDLERRRAARDYLDVVRGRMDGADRARVGTVLIEGDTVDALLARVEARHIDLVVMTTHARGGVGRAWLGSVADGLVRRSVTPVLTLRPRANGSPPEHRTAYPHVPVSVHPGFGHVLLPLDGSTAGEAMIEHAVGVAGDEGVRYTLLRVLTAEESPLRAILPRHGETPSSRTQRATVEATLEAGAEALRRRGLDARAQVITDDAPARGILAYAGEHGVDLIAMTTRSSGGLERLLLGSVADEVLRGWHGPLLLRHPAAGEGARRQ
ncbi:MAG TPA: universal stress protein [Gemmatimonadales bacterium]